MAETSFIKTVAFGGYDKMETEKLFEAMNQQICELQNELRENKLLLENYKSDTDTEKNFESVLSEERTKLSQLQVQNETLAAKNKDLDSEMRDKELEIRELKATVDDLKKKLSAAGNSGSDNSAVAMSKAFLEAQKSSDEMLERARDEAESLRKNAVRLAESIIDEANDKAGRIISEASEKASASAASQHNTNNNLFDNFSKLGSQLNILKDLLSDFERSGMECITQCENIISDTADDMKKSSADAQEAAAVQNDSSSPETENNSSAGIKEKTENVSEQPENVDENSSEDQSDDLDMLMAMAEALND